MDKNPYQILAEEIEDCMEVYTPTPSTPNRPTTPVSIPGKKKAKRKIDSLIPAITPIKTTQPRARQGKTTTGYLNLARKALEAALEAEKRELGEDYIVDNDIQLMYNELETILEKRLIEIEPCSLENLGL
jgi:hypothetical protein